MNKGKIVEEILIQLNLELATLTQSARSAHEAATHEESKAEDKHDTRGLEASYLAGAQAGRIAELKQQISVFRQFPIREFAPSDRIALGAVVETLSNGKRYFFFLVSHRGGLSVRSEGQSIQIISMQSPIGEALDGRKAGEEIEVETQNQTRTYQVLSVF